ncbi:flavin reductase [Bailinhaonella thermotolerans]|uniref:Flavin reductase n=1 Tax=Bailinhaonella thermotolerans TaxID=1070861 RepID=A0A3A4B826_9ACTN|nr:flavin reductase [Bailinhaonella thermotolerans]
MDPAAYRAVAGRFATGVVVVTARAGGLDHAMTANSFTSVSLDPLLVLFCPEKISRLHAAVLEAGRWGVSVLGEEHEEVSRFFATRGREVSDRLDSWSCHRGPRTGVALLDDAIATLECRTHAVHDGGDHSIVVGEVIGVDLRRPEARPLLYYAGGYRGLDRPPGGE